MKKFIVTVLSISVFFIGLGSLIEKASASFKSDEKALELIAKARRAIGGDAAISGVKSMTILGKTTKTFEVEGVARNENGETEINFELPNKMSRTMKMGSGGSDAIVDKKVDVMVVRTGDDNLKWKTESNENPDGVKRVIIQKKDGSSEEVKTEGGKTFVLKREDNGDQTVITSEDGKTTTVDGKKVFIRKAEAIGGSENMRSNELFRTTLSLLLSAPEGLDVTYTYVGEGSVDGVSCDIISANDGGSTVKLYLDKTTSLPRMMTFQGHKPFMIRINKDEALANKETETKIFTRQLAQPEMAEFQVKFSDFRSAGGLQLPFKWTQTVGGKDDEVLDITSYEVNPSNIADKFKEMPMKVFVRTQKEQ
jgi:hypothetical protein